MKPDDANIAGNVHGGTILKMIEEAGIIASTRHCNHPAHRVGVSKDFNPILPRKSTWPDANSTPCQLRTKST